MKKVFYIFILLFIQTICFAEHLNKVWIQKDIKNFEKVLTFIDKEDYSNSTILNFMSKNAKNEKLGFDLFKSKSSIPGGYLSIYFTYIRYKDSPCELRISFYINDFSKIEKEIPSKQIKTIKKKFILDEKYYSFTIKNNENYQNYYEYKYKQIGNSINLNLSSKYQIYYDFLTSPFNDFSYGYIIGDAPMVPYGRVSMEELMELKNLDIFINIIKSDNPAGRMYGMEGLLRLDNSSKNINIVNEVFEKLIKDEITYEAQDGCIITDEFYEIINSENINKYMNVFSFEIKSLF